MIRSQQHQHHLLNQKPCRGGPASSVLTGRVLESGAHSPLLPLLEGCWATSFFSLKQRYLPPHLIGKNTEAVRRLPRSATITPTSLRADGLVPFLLLLLVNCLCSHPRPSILSVLALDFSPLKYSRTYFSNSSAFITPLVTFVMKIY